MLRIRQILVSASFLAGAVVTLSGCGQKGALFLPTDPAAANRATLPQTLRPDFATPPAPSASAPGAEGTKQ